MKRIILFIFVILWIFSVPVQAEKMRVAVLDLQPKGISNILAGAVTDIIRSEMVKTGLYNVLERERMDEILKEQELQMTGCTDSTCAVQIGKVLSARKIMLGEINKIGRTFMITVRIVDVETAMSEFAANEKADSEDKLDIAAKNITKSLSKNIVEGNKEFFEEFVVQRKTASGYYTRCIVPGWGQFYADKPAKGYIFLGTFITAVGFTTYAYFDYTKAANDYNDLPRGASRSEFDSKYDDKKKAGELFMIAGGITAAVYLIHWVDALFFSKPNFQEKSAKNETGNLFYNISYLASPDNSRDQITRFSVGLRF